MDFKLEVIVLPVSDVEVFHDAGGNGWFLQEITNRLPGR
jgi:hypothetical protein